MRGLVIVKYDKLSLDYVYRCGQAGHVIVHFERDLIGLYRELTPVLDACDALTDLRWHVDVCWGANARFH